MLLNSNTLPKPLAIETLIGAIGQSEGRKLLYEGRKLCFSEGEILRLLGVNCDKINHFLRLYLTYDGLFLFQAMMVRYAFYPIEKGVWDKIEIAPSSEAFCTSLENWAL